MKLISLKIFFPILFLFVLYIINAHYEIFALNIPNGEGNEKAKGCIRVMTWNVNAPRGTENAEVVRTELIAEIEKQNPDILCLQELSPKIFTEIKNSLDNIFGYTDSMAIKRNPSRYWIYSKKPLRNFRRYKSITEIDTIGFDVILQNEIKIIQEQLPFCSTEVEVTPGHWITVFACHLRSSAYSTARRSMKEGSSWPEGISLYIDNYKFGKKIRDYEADNLRIYLDSLETKGTPIIIAGDFNDWCGSYCLNTICNNKFKDAWWEEGLGFGITYDEWHLKLRLDHILFSHYFNIFKIIVDDNSFSDHYPLVADFSME